MPDAPWRIRSSSRAAARHRRESRLRRPAARERVTGLQQAAGAGVDVAVGRAGAGRDRILGGALGEFTVQRDAAVLEEHIRLKRAHRARGMQRQAQLPADLGGLVVLLGRDRQGQSRRSRAMSSQRMRSPPDSPMRTTSSPKRQPLSGSCTVI